MGRRPDGYHEIRTLFQLVDLCDEIILEQAPRGVSISTSAAGVPRDGTNLCVAAARRLERFTRGRQGVRIFLKKRIPVAAGLGGASSNAASTLLGLNRLWNLRLPRKVLNEEARAIGADVPFFVSGCGSAWGLARGDRIVPADLRAPFWALIVTPSVPVRTDMIYSYIGSMGPFLTSPVLGARMPRKILQPLSDIIQLLHNDLQKVTVVLKPVVGRLIHCLRSIGVQSVCMSGSGPSVFALFTSKEEAVRTRDRLRSQLGSQGAGPARFFVAKALGSSFCR